MENDFLMIQSGNSFDFSLITGGTVKFNSTNSLHTLSALDG